MDPRHQAPSRPENKSLNSYLICRNFTFVRHVFGDKLTESEKTSADLSDTNFCFYQALSYKCYEVVAVSSVKYVEGLRSSLGFSTRGPRLCSFSSDSSLFFNSF